MSSQTNLSSSGKSRVRRGSKVASRSESVKRADQLMTIPEAAQYLAVSERRLYRLARQRWGKDRFPAFKVRGVWYVDSEEMVDWVLGLVQRGVVLSFTGARVKRGRHAGEAQRKPRPL